MNADKIFGYKQRKFKVIITKILIMTIMITATRVDLKEAKLLRISLKVFLIYTFSRHHTKPNKLLQYCLA